MSRKRSKKENESGEPVPKTAKRMKMSTDPIEREKDILQLVQDNNVC